MCAETFNRNGFQRMALNQMNEFEDVTGKCLEKLVDVDGED